MVVDDDESTTRVLEQFLHRAGYKHVVSTSDPRQVLALYEKWHPDILLLDIRMPYLDGFSIMRQVRSRSGGEFLPILVITGDTDPAVKEQALASGANDFLAKPYDATEVALRVHNLLETRALTLDLESRVRERTRKLRRSEIEAAHRLALAAELRDYRSGGHIQRVGRMAAIIAAELGMGDEEVDLIGLAAPLHDLGKVAIPDRILLKAGPLAPEERRIVRMHTSIGARMLSGSDSSILRRAEEIALYHHENWDGTGYTPGLDGYAIPVSARIVRVADVFDALIQERPYKPAWAVQRAVAMIRDGAGTLFDPEIVDVFDKVHAKAASLPGWPAPGEGMAARLDTWDDLSDVLDRVRPQAWEIAS